ncbi:MAG: cupredoxin domain-containing protein [Armatimonadota bacterium]|nr:cupredoxin domain-containing protein [Armatimonadota bacterium]
MRRRILLVGLTVVLVGLLPASVPAQTRRVVQVAMTSYRFEPSLITVRQGETVIIQAVNADPERRNHSIAAALFAAIPVTVRGEVARQGEFEGRRFFVAEPGKGFELEFTASQRGTFTFICGVSDHAARGQVGAITVLPPAAP